jgi:hypothetical protein
LANLLFLSLLHHSQAPQDQTSLRSRKVTMLSIPRREPDAAVSQTAPVLPNRKPRKDNGAVVVLRTTAPSISSKTTGTVPPASTLGVPGTAELQLPPSRQADAEGSPQSLNLNLPQAFLRGDRPTARSEALAHPASNTARLNREERAALASGAIECIYQERLPDGSIVRQPGRLVDLAPTITDYGVTTNKTFKRCIEL